MFRRLILASILLVLAYGFWLSPDFNTVAAGVCIFLFGMLSLEKGFKSFAGGLLEKILNISTNRLWKSMGFGLVSTTLMQSSSLVSIITISFLSAGLITLASGIGIIFGANLGTTTGAWLVAAFGLKVNISAYAMPMLVFGTVLLFQDSRRTKGVGYLLVGLGFLFLGIHYMKEGFEAFKDQIDLTSYAISGFAGLLTYALIGTIATVIMQSSHATLILIITALASGQITYENALALAIGSNIGTTITAILGAISANINGKRLAVAHLLFNFFTGMVAIVFITQLTQLVDIFAQKTGITADNYTLKLAVFHSLFNLLGILLMMPFINPLVKLLDRVLPEKKKMVAEPIYLHDAVIGFPDTALESMRKETLNLFEKVYEIICKGLSVSPADVTSYRPLRDIIQEQNAPIPVDIDLAYESQVKVLYSAMVLFASRVQEGMSKDQTNMLFELRSAGADLVEALKDTKHLRKNLEKYIRFQNTAIKDEYDSLRYEILLILRGLKGIQSEIEEGNLSFLLSIDRMRTKYEEADKDFLSSLDNLIRDEKITPAMATSLVNDHNYVKSIIENLLQAGHALFTPVNEQFREAQESMMLDESEVADALKEREAKERGATQ